MKVRCSGSFSKGVGTNIAAAQNAFRPQKVYTLLLLGPVGCYGLGTGLKALGLPVSPNPTK